ncbi:SubName: Full=Uncharacterized protein {ECO:0000313/EMBL:CCA68234.1} [Serendipita indica DSM 11827]|nr:SubName: Full=Uncharacterized protein {ECO:0000313/EMBL:CCA68234.1} [Serendipita indica DSM 11827]
MDPPLAPEPENAPDIPNGMQPDTSNDDNVRIAADALENMRSTPLQHPQLSNETEAGARRAGVFAQARNLYDYSKSNSRLVSYGAGMVESGVQAISRPVLDRVLNYGRSEPAPAPSSASVPPPRDDSQSMQLDASERDSSSSDPAREEQRLRALSWTHQQRAARRVDSDKYSASSEQVKMSAEDGDDDDHMDLSSQDRSQGTSSGSGQPVLHTESSASTRKVSNDDQASSQAVSRRPGWHSLMIEAGGISAAVSDESMRKLKYCLEWLQWATANLDTQITLLETFIASINATVTGEPVPSSATVSPEALKHYMSVKRNVVNTIRQVVEVVGKYAGGSLPEPAKNKVKGFILSLPGRWSVAVKDAGLGEGWEGGSNNGDSNGNPTPNAPDSATATGRATASTSNPRKRHRLEASSQSLASEATTGSSATIIGSSIGAGPSSTSLASSTHDVPAPVTSPTLSHATPGGRRQQLLPPTAGAARHAAHRVLTLAQESLHAVKGVTGVFKDTLDRAETWVDRLRRVGYQSNRYMDDSDHSTSNSISSSRLLRPPHKGIPQSPSVPLSPAVSSPRSPMERRRMQMTPRELHLEALARSMPSVGPYGPYGTGTTPPMSPVLGPQGSTNRQNAFPFDNPAPGAPGYGWVGGRRKSDSGLSAVPTLNLSETGYSGRSRAGSMSQYESSTGESLPPPSVGSTSSVAGDDELDDEADDSARRVRVANPDSVKDVDEDDGMEYRVRKRRRKEEEMQ